MAEAAVYEPAQHLRSAAHPDDGTSRRRVTVNVAENPLSWLHARKLLTDRQLAAGTQLHGDFMRAGLNASVTMRWDAPPRDGSPRNARGADHGTIGRIDAKRRFDAAMDAVGAGLNDICWRVICAGEGMAGAERALGWPGRSGRIILTLALDRLADHYRLPG